MTKERDELYKDISQFKQEIMLLKQDKEYLHKQFVESQNKQILTDNKLEQVIIQYEDVKRAREEIYEKYINSK
jgi:progesterone-induced-blocking factor 1